MEEARPALLRFGHVTAGTRQVQPAGKLEGLEPGIIDRLFRAAFCDWIIVEADGARRKPLKTSDTHEPVVPESTTHLVLVSGLDALGSPLDEEHVHRAHLFSRATGVPMGAAVDERAMALSARRELDKAAALPVRPPLCFVLLNKADTPGKVLRARALADRLCDHGIPLRVIVTALDRERPVQAWSDTGSKAQGNPRGTRWNPR
jgi:probable selenium-dependent hydroxylase accessory protein YqeC